MALPKKIKIGGGYYKGYKCAVAAGAGAYSTLITNASGAAMNSLSITPDFYGGGDTMTITHYADAGGAGKVLAILGEVLHNVGAHSAISLDFPAAELVDSGQSVKFTYTNSAGTASGSVYLIAEWVGLKKTA